MKKLSFGLGLVFSSFSMSAFAALPNCDVSVNLPSRFGGFLFGITGLYWRASVPNETFAHTFPNNNTDFGVTVPPTPFLLFTQQGSGSSQSHNPYHQWGLKANMGFLFPCYGYDLTVTYTHWDHIYKASAIDVLAPGNIEEAIADTGPLIPFVEGTGAFPGVNFSAIVPLVRILISPAFVPTITDIAARSQQEFDNHTWDIDFGHTVAINCLSQFRWYAGLRYSKVEYNVNTFFDTLISGETTPGTLVVIPAVTLRSVFNPLVVDYGGFIAATVALDAHFFERFNQHNKFDGVGPRLGFDFNYGFCGNFGIVAGASGSLLIGEQKASVSDRTYVEGNSIFANVVGDVLPIINDTALADPLLFPTEFSSPFQTDTGDLVFDHPDDTRVVPNIDAKIGINWQYNFGRCKRSKVSLEVGYMVSHYFNVIDFTPFATIFENTLSGFHQRVYDASFDGPYGSIQVKL